MNKKITIVIAIFVVILLSFIIWNKWISPHQWGRCTSADDCAPFSPRPGFYYVCEDGQCMGKPLVDESNQCSVNEDCVPAICCHASTAVNKKFAPNCAGVFCTQECAPNTLDCGQGEIVCLDGVCQVIMLDQDTIS